MFQNRISLIGFTGTDAQVRVTKNNRTYIVLSLATKRTWLDKNGQRVSRTEWHRLIAWDKIGGFAKDIAKGSHVKVVGELRSRDFIGKNGIQHRFSEIHLGSIRKLGRAVPNPGSSS